MVAVSALQSSTLLTGRIATDRVAETSGSVVAAQEAARESVPAGRLGTVEEFAAMAAFLCSERASFVTGAAMPVGGGLLQSV